MICIHKGHVKQGIIYEEGLKGEEGSRGGYGICEENKLRELSLTSE